MKFNLYFENGVPVDKNLIKSPKFKKQWEEKELVALKVYFGEKCEIKK